MDTLGELVVPIAVLAIVVALITPLPGFVLDLLIVIDILVSVIVLMVSLYLVRPVEFTVIPHHPAAADALPPRAEHLLVPSHPAQRQYRDQRPPEK